MRPQIKSVCFLTMAIFFLHGARKRLLAQYPLPDPERVYAIKAGKLVDPEKGTTEKNQTILVRERRLKLSAAICQSPRTQKIIDLSKSTVLPGLFDAHTHLCMTSRKTATGKAITSPRCSGSHSLPRN